MTPAELRARTAKLRALAQAATLGPWVTRDPIRAGFVADTPIRAISGRARNGRVGSAKLATDAAHIAAHDPAAVLAQCDALDLLADMADAAGDWVCDCRTDNAHRKSLLARFAALGDDNA